MASTSAARRRSWCRPCWSSALAQRGTASNDFVQVRARRSRARVVTSRAPGSRARWRFGCNTLRPSGTWIRPADDVGGSARHWQVLAVEAHGAAPGRAEAADHLVERGLARAVAAQQRHHLAGVHPSGRRRAAPRRGHSRRAGLRFPAVRSYGGCLLRPCAAVPRCHGPGRPPPPGREVTLPGVPSAISWPRASTTAHARRGSSRPASRVRSSARSRRRRRAMPRTTGIDLGDLLRVEAGQHLVEQQQARPVASARASSRRLRPATPSRSRGWACPAARARPTRCATASASRRRPRSRPRRCRWAPTAMFSRTVCAAKGFTIWKVRVMPSARGLRCGSRPVMSRAAKRIDLPLGLAEARHAARTAWSCPRR